MVNFLLAQSNCWAFFYLLESFSSSTETYLNSTLDELVFKKCPISPKSVCIGSKPDSCLISKLGPSLKLQIVSTSPITTLISPNIAHVANLKLNTWCPMYLPPSAPSSLAVPPSTQSLNLGPETSGSFFYLYSPSL